MKCIWMLVYICGKLMSHPFSHTFLAHWSQINKKATHCASFTVFSERTDAAKFSLRVKAKWLQHYIPALIRLQFTYDMYSTWTVWDADRRLYDLIDMIEKVTQSQWIPEHLHHKRKQASQNSICFWYIFCLHSLFPACKSCRRGRNVGTLLCMPPIEETLASYLSMGEASALKALSLPLPAKLRRVNNVAVLT